MKLFPIIAAVALNAVVAFGKDSNADLQQGSMTFEEFLTQYGDGVDLTATSGSEYESFADRVASIIRNVEEWSDIQTGAMADTVGPSSVEFKKFQKKMGVIDVLVADIKRLRGEESTDALNSIVHELQNEIDITADFVNDTFGKSLAKTMESAMEDLSGNDN